MAGQKQDESLVPLAFPSKGIDISVPLDKQPELTTPIGQNVRLHEALSSRARGGSRSGLRPFSAGLLPNSLPPGGGAIQGLDAITTISPTHGCGCNYQDGSFLWNTLAHAGTYVLGKPHVNDDPKWDISCIIGVAEDGSLLPGQVIDGTPQGLDQPVVAGWVLTGLQVLAYWEPGAFPFTADSFDQFGDVFPGFGWIISVFPDIRFDGRQILGLPAATVHDPTPIIPTTWWNWNSGCADSSHDPAFRRGFVLGLDLEITDPLPLATPSTVEFALACNGNVVLRGSMKNGQTDEESLTAFPGFLTGYNRYLVYYDERFLPLSTNSFNFLSSEFQNTIVQAPLVKYRTAKSTRPAFQAKLNDAANSLSHTLVTLALHLDIPSNNTTVLAIAKVWLWYSYSFDLVNGGDWQWVPAESITFSGACSYQATDFLGQRDLTVTV